MHDRKLLSAAGAGKRRPAQPFRRRPLALAVLLACAVWPASAASPGAVADYYHAMLLPQIPRAGPPGVVSGQTYFRPVGITEGNRIIGNAYGSMGGRGASWQWSPTGGAATISLGSYMGAESPLWDVSPNGDFVVGRGFYDGTGGQPITPLLAGASPSDYPGWPQFGFASSVNDQGWVLARSYPPMEMSLEWSEYRLLLLRPGQAPIDLGSAPFPYGSTLATGIAAGSIHGATPDTTTGVVWTEAGGARAFSALAVSHNTVTGVNQAGLVVGTAWDVSSPAANSGFLYDSHTAQTLHVWGDFRPTAINSAGLVVGNRTGGRGGVMAWSGGDVVDLASRTIPAGLLGAYELTANDGVFVNDQGFIVANAVLTQAARDAGRDQTLDSVRAVMLAPCLSLCGQIRPYPNPAGTTLNVGGNWFDAHNAVDFENGGILELRTNVSNRAEGLLHNLSSGEIIVGNFGGNFENRGRIVNDAGGLLQIDGIFRHSTPTVVKSPQVELTNRGRMVVTGQLSVAEDAAMLVEEGGTLVQNSGLIEIRGITLISGEGNAPSTKVDEFKQLAGGTLSVSRTGAIGLDRDADMHLGGTVSVDGTVKAFWGGIFAEGHSADVRFTPDSVLILGDRSQITASDGARMELGGKTTMRGARTGAYDAAQIILSGKVDLLEESRFDLLGSQTALTAGSVSGHLDISGDSSVHLTDNSRLSVSGIVQNDGRVINLGGRIVLEGERGFFWNGESGNLHLAGNSTFEITQGSNVLWNRGNIDLDGTLEVRGGLLWNSRSITTSQGSIVKMAGLDANLDVTKDGSITGRGQFLQDSGHTKVNGLIDLPFIYFSGGRLSGSGTLRGDQIIFGLGMDIDKRLTIQPGNSPGTLTVDGNLSIDNALLEIEIGDYRHYDRLVVLGNLQVSQLSAVLLPEAGYVPDLNDRFDWISAGSVMGDLSSVTVDGSAFAPGSSWTTRVVASATGARLFVDNSAALAFGPDLIDAGTRFEVPAGALAHISGGRTVQNQGELVIAGALAVRGESVPGAGNGSSLQGDGSLHIANGGRLSTRGSVDVGGGGAVNEGLLRVYEDGAFGHHGVFRNAGVVEMAGQWNGNALLENQSGATFRNHGTMQITTLINQGRFETTGLIDSPWSGAVQNFGEFVVHTGGRVTLYSGGWGPSVVYRDYGSTQVDGRLEASQLELYGTVSGSGVIAGDVRGGGRFALGDGSTGPLTIEGRLAGWHTYDIELGGATSFGRLMVTGDTALGGGQVNFWLAKDGYRPKAGDSYTWLTVSGMAGGLGALSYRLVERHDGGWTSDWVAPSDLRMQFDGATLTVAAVPEPETWAMMIAGLGLLAWRGRARLAAARAR